MNWFSDKPCVFSFVHGRSEAYGTVLVNPYTKRQTVYTPAQSSILNLLDGSRTPIQILIALLLKNGIRPSYVLAAISDIGRSLDLLKEQLAICSNPATTGTSVEIACPRPIPNGWAAAPDAVTWEVTSVCNLRCKHCLAAAPYVEGSGLLEAASVCSSWRPIIESLRKMGVFTVTLTGGEPLLHPEILTIIDALNEAGISVDIATNGYGIGEHVFAELSARRISSIQVSIDGFEDYHDQFRGLPGVFTQSSEALDRFKREGFSTSVSTTVTPQNLELIPDLAAWAFKKGCLSYKSIPMMSAGRAQHQKSPRGLSGSEFRRFALLLRDLNEQYKGRMEIYTASAMMHLLGDQPVAPSDRDDLTATPMGCAAGKSTLNIGVDGSVSPCPFLRTRRLGNLLEEPLWEIWDSSPTLQELRSLTLADFPEACQSCGHAGATCAGGCRASAYSKTGSLCGKDPSCFS